MYIKKSLVGDILNCTLLENHHYFTNVSFVRRKNIFEINKITVVLH